NKDSVHGPSRQRKAAARMPAKSPLDRFGISLGLFAAAAAAWGQPGSLDPSFVPQTAPALIVSQVALQPDGKVLYLSELPAVPGSGPDGDVLAMAIQIDGRILIGGRFAAVNGTSRSGITRLNGDGSVDSSFDPGAGVYQAASNEVRAIKALPDGKILLAGAFT